MRKSFVNLSQLIRLLIIFIVVSINIINRSDVNDFYIFIFLAFIFNSQLRVNIIKDKWYPLSTLIDIGLLLILCIQYERANYLFFYILVLDNVSINKFFSYSVIPIIIYFSYYSGLEVLALNFMIIIFMMVFGNQLYSLQEKIEEIEELYDRNRRYSYQLENAKKTLEDYSKKVENQAQLEERSRLAVEIHDTIGHKLTALLMQMEAILIVKEKEPQKAEELLYSSRDLLKNCVNILRSTVKNIKPKKHRSGILALVDFLDEFSRETDTKTNFNIVGSPYDLLPGEVTALYRNLQEAATNAIKHGNAKNLDIVVHYNHDSLMMTVIDDGIGCNNLSKGMGISGMEDRVALFGGEIKVELLERGFSISTIIPVQGRGEVDENKSYAGG
ncbi:sensor histidine kinase [Alkaliphilus serpentinus]|uniref:histidine kinase n=1 Tax=Alkaliphilus serpentinus TaxID=1482731 RepID=A0A833HQ42_9FIRM|nr:sensor histidine kinase [Alkaliphilus serpentinus]KAB3531509.1 sensor histidine kinase [Alkaliphilus serpentinus]